VLDLARHAFVSLTGGEPLLQPEVVRALAEALRGRGPRIHLETHGLAHEALAHAIDVVDLVAMDWKLASDVRREGESFKGPGADFRRRRSCAWQACRCCEIVISRRAVMTKCSGGTASRASIAVLLVLQPVTPRGPGRAAERSTLLALAAAAEPSCPACG
jgi:organic radical activating enzyme